MASVLCLILSATYVCAIDDGDRIDQSKLPNSINEFAFELYRAICKSVDDNNIIISPASIATALAMVYIGARGETRRQMTSAMHLNVYNSSDETSLKKDFRKLIQTLSKPQNNYTLYIANRLFGQEGYNFTDEFCQDTEDYFKAPLETLDFSNNPNNSRVHINEWVAEQTSDKIKDLLPDGIITTLTKLALVNAIYFKGLWSNQFDKQATKSETFYLSVSEMTQVDMMHLGRKRLNYYNSSELGCQVVELPYIGNQSSMFILLPHDIKSLSAVESRLGADPLDRMFTGLKSGVEVRLNLPRFTIRDQGVVLNECLKAIGMVDMFDEAKANLSGIDGTTELCVSNVIHKAYVEVNEEGTEAAAATGAVVNFRSIAPDKVIDFVANRPIIFLIVDKATHSIMFLGRLTRPARKDVDTNTSFPETTPRQ